MVAVGNEKQCRVSFCPAALSRKTGTCPEGSHTATAAPASPQSSTPSIGRRFRSSLATDSAHPPTEAHGGGCASWARRRLAWHVALLSLSSLLLGTASALTEPARTPGAACLRVRAAWCSGRSGRGSFARPPPALCAAARAPWCGRHAAPVLDVRCALSDAERVLAAFDAEQQRIAREGLGGVREGFGGGTSAARWAAAHPDWPALRSAVLALAGESEKVMMGICAEDAFEGVAALKEWVSALQLPRGRLHGMDKDGQPLDMSDFGPVYIKYTSAGGQVSGQGDAMLNGYAGSYRGVYFNPVLPDGEFRQYAVLPLFLFDSRKSTAGAVSDASAPVPARPANPPASAPKEARAGGAAPHGGRQAGSRAPLNAGRVRELLASVSAALDKLGASVEVLEVDDATAAVCLDFDGPEVLKFGITNSLQAEGVKTVVFNPDALSSAAYKGVAATRSGGDGVIEYDGVDA